MKLIKYIYILIILFSLNFCTVNRKFDRLFDKEKYEEAYAILKQKGKQGTLYYQERELKVLFYLTINNTEKYMALLDDALLNTEFSELINWHNLARSWIRFLSAETEIDYQNLLVILPSKSFVEEKSEQIRLIMQIVSLLKLDRTQEALAHLRISKLTKKSSDLSYLQGIANYKLNQNKEAEKSFQHVISIGENKKLIALAYYYLGNIYQKQGDVDKTEQYYRKAWENNAFIAELNFQLGKTLQKKSYGELHYRFYRASLRLNENLAESWYYLNI